MTAQKFMHLYRNIGIVVTVLIIMLIAVVSAFYYPPTPTSIQTPTPTSTQTPTPTPMSINMQTPASTNIPTNEPSTQEKYLTVGDTFYYSLKGISNLIGPNAVTPAGFEQFNDTDYYKITITAVSGNTVSMDTIWRFKNGTTIPASQTIDVSGKNPNSNVMFWALYPADLTTNDRLRPLSRLDKTFVNSTETRQFADGNWPLNIWSIDNSFYDPNDPTMSTWRDDYIFVDFDKQTGMLVTLTNIQTYNNPQYSLTISWNLTNSTAWNV
jgi:hypothetical protein